MEEEKVTIEETQPIENTPKNNKGIKIFLYIIIFVIAIVGIVLAVNGIEFKSNDDKKYTEVDNDKEQQEEQPEEEEEPTTPGEEKPEIPIAMLDSYIAKANFKVTKEDRETLINSTNCSMCLTSSLYGEMYKDEISNNYKLLYTVHELWSLTYNEISDTDNHMDWFGDVTISETILLENAKKIFDKVELPPSFNKDLFYMGTSGLVCTNGICTFNQSTFGATGISPFSGYENKLTTEGNNIKVEQLYIEDEYVNYNEENDTYIFDIKLYDKKGGNLIKEFKSYEIDLNGEFDPYETFFIYYDKVQTYIYKFDDNNKLLEVTKVDE